MWSATRNGSNAYGAARRVWPVLPPWWTVEQGFLKRRDSSVSQRIRVLSILHPRQLSIPCGLIWGGNTIEDGFQLLISPPHLVVGLRVETRGQTDLGPLFQTKLLEHPRSEPWSQTISYGIPCKWNIWLMSNLAISKAAGRQSNKVSRLGKPISYGEDGGITWRRWQSRAMCDHGLLGVGSGQIRPAGRVFGTLFWAQTERAAAYSWASLTSDSHQNRRWKNWVVLFLPGWKTLPQTAVGTYNRLVGLDPRSSSCCCASRVSLSISQVREPTMDVSSDPSRSRPGAHCPPPMPPFLQGQLYGQ